jgi:hypothetical protein
MYVCVMRCNLINWLAGLVACGTEQHGIRLCDLRTGDAVHSLLAPLTQHEGGGGSGSSSSSSVKALDWCPSGDGHLLVAGSMSVVLHYA